MTPALLHGIGVSDRLVEGTFRQEADQWILHLMDGSDRAFGAVTPYSAEAVRFVEGLGGAYERSQVPTIASMHEFARAASLNIEVTPFCSVGCHTCIASSVATRVGELSVTAFRHRLMKLLHDPRMQRDVPIMISGGEPAQHPDFFNLVTAPEFLNFSHRFVISSGHALADPAFARAFREQSPGTQLYLQYDSFDAEHVRLIRGHDFTSIHERVIANCEEYEIPYTLVCVILRNLNDQIAAELVERSLSNRYCNGVTFQPIKFVGRNDAANDEHKTNTFDLVAELQPRLARDSGIVLAPHPANPLNWAIGYADGSSHASSSLYEIGHNKRVAVVWHTDRENYVLESVARSPIAFAEPDDVVPQEVHYKAI